MQLRNSDLYSFYQKSLIARENMKWTVVFGAFAALVCKCYSTNEIPPFLHVCSKSEPNLLECFITAGEEIRPYLAKGVPDYGIPSLEPLVIDELISEESAGLRLTSTDVKAWGCTDYFVRKIDINTEKQTYEIEIDLPLLRIESRYNVTGKILLMPIKGEGPLEANVTSCKAKTFLQGELYDKDGETYLKYTNMTIKVAVGDGHVKVQNLFNGDKLLNDIVNDTINKNLGAFLHELMPVIERALGAAFLNIANKVVEKFTYAQLFPN